MKHKTHEEGSWNLTIMNCSWTTVHELLINSTSTWNCKVNTSLYFFINNSNLYRHTLLHGYSYCFIFLGMLNAWKWFKVINNKNGQDLFSACVSSGGHFIIKRWWPFYQSCHSLEIVDPSTLGPQPSWPTSKSCIIFDLPDCIIFNFYDQADVMRWDLTITFTWTKQSSWSTTTDLQI